MNFHFSADFIELIEFLLNAFFIPGLAQCTRQKLKKSYLWTTYLNPAIKKLHVTNIMIYRFKFFFMSMSRKLCKAWIAPEHKISVNIANLSWHLPSEDGSHDSFSRSDPAPHCLFLTANLLIFK